MSSDDFWNGDPAWLLSYIEAYNLRLKREEEQSTYLIDYQSWLTGLYVHQGVQVALANSFSKTSRAKYIKEPISFSKKDKPLTEEEKNKKLEREFMQFKMLTDAMNKNLDKR